MTTLIELPDSYPAPARQTVETATQTPAVAPRRRASRATTSRTVSLSLTFAPPFVPGVEAQDQWDAHLRGVSEFYSPEGYVEDAIVFRIASHLWRLNRLARSEVDDLTQSIGDSERDAAGLVAAQSPHPSDSPMRPLPVDVAALRRRQTDARVAVQVLSAWNQIDGPAAVSDDKASAALALFAEYCSSLSQCQPLEVALTSPKLTRPHDGWTGTSLRTGLLSLPVNRSLGDVITASLPHIEAVASAAAQRLSQIEALTTRLRRQRLVPQSVLASHIREAEGHLSALLHQAILQLETLQAARAA